VELTLVELGRSAAQTFGHIVFISAHGGNSEAATRAVTRLRAESRDVLLWVPSSTAGATPGDGHAGRTETAIQLALAPGRVRVGLAEPGNRTPIAELIQVLRTGGVRAVSRNGVLGDPAGASAAEGAALLEALTADLLATVAEWRRAAPG
jgi:creatinine amidohydrolase/Fe(II)-dependent formamide hydrolase-like protein